MVIKKISKLFLFRVATGQYKPKQKHIRRRPTPPDFKACLAIRAQHERDYKQLAKQAAWEETKRLRYSADGPQITVTPTGSTWAEIAATAPAAPQVRRIRPAKVPENLCACKSCALAKQADRARLNAQNRRSERKALWKEIAALRRKLRRAQIPTPVLDGNRKWCGISYFTLFDIECENVDTKPSLVNRSTRVYFGPNIKAPKTKSVSPKTEDVDAAIDAVKDKPFLGLKPSQVVKRSLLLSYKLRSILNNFKNNRLINFFSLHNAAEEGVEVATDATPIEALQIPAEQLIEKPPTIYQVEMDGDTPHERANSKASNVVVQEAQEVETVVIGHRLKNLVKFCDTEVTKYEADMDRWIPVSKGVWSVSHNPSDDIAEIALPLDAIATVNVVGDNTQYVLKENVLANSLRVRQYWNSDITIKVQVNGTPFYQGQLICSWFYRQECDNNFDLREHVCSYSYTNHVIVDAGNANSGEITIPYRSYRPYLNIRARDNMDIPMLLGHLRIRPLVKLQAPGGSSSELNYVVLVKFDNCSLTGMITPDLPLQKEVEMFSMLPSAVNAAKALYNLYEDFNRDKPPTDLQPPQIVPIASSSLAHGRAVGDSVQPLRLDPIGQTPHFDLGEDEMTVSHVAGTYGFVKTIEIASSSRDLIYCVDAAPIMALKEYQYVEKDGVKCYYLPPVSVMSQLFAYWRGSLEYRFDFVATRYHQLRLWICWVPNYLGRLTFDQAVNCAGTYFDLKEDNRTVSITVPYIGDRPFWPHRYSTGVNEDEYEAPNQLCVYIVNNLTYTFAISPRIQMNVYVRGGKNFEVAVPCQPAIGLPFVAKFKVNSDTGFYAKSGYYPYYAGVWRNLENSTKLILRYGPTTDHISQFVSLSDRYYYKFQDSIVAASMKFKLSDGTVKNGANVCYVPVSVNDTYGAVYLGLILEEDVKDYYYERTVEGKWKKRRVYNRDSLLSAGDTSDNTYYSGQSNPKLIRTWVAPPPDETPEPPKIVEMDNKIVFEDNSSSLLSPMLYGESFMDLKDIMRRYQLYYSYSFTKLGQSLDGVDLRIPLLPQGLLLEPDTNPVQDAIRDGIIPIINSGYRFYRGGLRFKIVLVAHRDTTFMAQVRPDRSFKGPRSKIGGTSATDSLYNHGYATSIQCVGVNPILTIEVPMYMPGNCGMLQMPSDDALRHPEISSFFSLGELAISIASLHPYAKIYIYYSIADDFRASTFQGFPPMLMLRDYKPPKVEQEEDLSDNITESEFSML